MAKRLGEAYWRKQIKNWEGSGLTQAAYCVQHGLRAKTLSRWRNKALARTESANTAAPVTLVPVRLAASTPPSLVRLYSPGGWRIELPDNNAPWLTELLQQLP